MSTLSTYDFLLGTQQYKEFYTRLQIVTHSFNTLSTNLAFMGAYKVMKQLGDNTSSSLPPANLSEHTAQTTPKPFPLDLNSTSVQEKIQRLQHWNSAQKNVLRTSTPVSINMSNMTDFMEDYFTDVTYMTVSQGRLSVFVSPFDSIGPDCLFGEVNCQSTQTKNIGSYTDLPSHPPM